MTDDQLDIEVTFVLSKCVGKGHTISRWAMVERIFGLPVPEHLQNDSNPQDRLIRASVNRLRKQGHLICDLGDGQGWYLAATAEEFWEMYHFYVKPLRERAEVAQAMKRAARKQFPDLMQPSLFVMDDLEVAL
jgi:hypothetical protein